MTNLSENELLLRCACYSLDHIAFLIYEPDDSRGNNLKGYGDDWYLAIALDQHGFWKRLAKGLQYIFRPNSIKYGMYAELVLRTEDMQKLVEFVGERIR